MNVWWNLINSNFLFPGEYLWINEISRLMNHAFFINVCHVSVALLLSRVV